MRMNVCQCAILPTIDPYSVHRLFESFDLFVVCTFLGSGHKPVSIFNSLQKRQQKAYSRMAPIIWLRAKRALGNP